MQPSEDRRVDTYPIGVSSRKDVELEHYCTNKRFPIRLVPVGCNESVWGLEPHAMFPIRLVPVG